MEQWQNFLLAETGASAALTGLDFVGVSINLKRILSLPKLPSRALAALLLLLMILVLSCWHRGFSDWDYRLDRHDRFRRENTARHQASVSPTVRSEHGVESTRDFALRRGWYDHGLEWSERPVLACP